jgi:protein phosphatase
MKFKSFGFSDAGSIRKQNEDCYLCNEKERLFLVADGMGGRASGETASKLAVDCVEDFVVRSRVDDFKWPIEYRNDVSMEQNRLLAAAIFGNLKIRETAEQNPSMKGMGTTLIGGIIEEDNLAVVNVGDSRLYRVRDGKIRQITEDQSVVGEQERNGMLTREEARQHPLRHVLTSALGHINDQSKIDIFLTKIMVNDLYLICTDGLYNMLDDSELLSIINSIEDRSLYKMGLSLALKANLAGGLDNITVVLLSFDSAEEV